MDLILSQFVEVLQTGHSPEQPAVPDPALSRLLRAVQVCWKINAALTFLNF